MSTSLFVGFFVGLVVGFSLGLLTASLMVMAGRQDRQASPSDGN